MKTKEDILKHLDWLERHPDPIEWDNLIRLSQAWWQEALQSAEKAQESKG